MRNQSTHLVLAIGAGLLLGWTTDASAQRPFGRHHAGRPGHHPGIGSAIGDFAELATHRDEIASYRRTKLLGSGYYAKMNFRLHAEHARIYELIAGAVTGDRLGEPEGRAFVDRLIAIGTEAKALLGTGEALAETDAETIKTKLDELGREVAKAVANKVEPDEVSVTVNRGQWAMDELHRFGATEGVLSSAKADGLRRKLDALERREDSAKQDNKLSEKERENLLEETHETWRWCMEAFS
jgi:hypothetical protein